MNNSEIKVLIFKINDQYYATDIMEVERILGYSEPTKLPDSPEFVEGVINYEGHILPIMSLVKKFNIDCKESEEDAKIIVAKQEENKIGIIVDIVSEVRDVKMENIEEPPEIVAGISKRYIKGLIKTNEQIIIFLNLSTILTREEKEQILR
ncbi:chemotaxis protein CheW [Clostridium sp. MB40-C1]|uniref:chemotaxis protein CheW n=1 Tax=Clostridium sp. MB40-C1 TaxID=3070996 RepID=UPI0027E1E04F|nr:chemotaxis protein CheW [Clostridium sp. MB40-C1]WMJ81289.1 chemotaxis protein CheW [Clostridium sp. MB40-C1]